MSSSLRVVAIAVMAGLATVSCDKVPLLAPTNTTIRLIASVGVLPTNGSTEITASVIESAGTPVQNGTVVTFTSSLGAVEPREARTSNGQVTVRFLAGSQSGAAKVGAFSGGSRAEDVEILVGSAAAGAITVRATPQAVPVTGGTADVVATVVDTGGNPLRGAQVTFSTTFGQLSQSAAISDEAGEARTQLTTTVTAKVTARVGSGSSAPSAEVEVTARNAPAVAISAGTGNIVEAGLPAVFTLTPPDAATSNAIREVIVNFGDGTVRNIGPLLAPTTISHTYGRPGPYTVTATATDTLGFTATTSIAVTVNAAATVPITIRATLGAGGIVSFDASVTGSIPGGGAIRTYEWDFGDGGGTTTTGPSTSHRYLAGGTFVVSLRVVTTTGQDGYAEQTVRVTIF